MPKRPADAVTPVLVTPPERPLDRPVASSPSKPKPKKEEAAVKKSFTLYPRNTAYVDKLALKLGAERGKSMNASEVMRLIIDEHENGKGRKS